MKNSFKNYINPWFCLNILISTDDFHQEDQVHLENGFKCINAVLEVNYKFFWRGNEITRMNANILLGNLTLILEKQMETTGRKAKVLSSTQFQELHQIFSVDYQVKRIYNFVSLMFEVRKVINMKEDNSTSR